MKLHSIHFKNINCLAGEWVIDFEDPGLKDNLFVLSGPTGAGKSSILDAITLALFGRTARQKDVGSGTNEIMTHGTDSCFAEADFTGMDGVRYQSRWSQECGKHKDGSPYLYTPKVELREADTGHDLSFHKSSETWNKVAEKVGFGFSDFIRTVLLEQGRFDEFLHAQEKDRATILEQATDTAHFSAIGVKINERAKSENNQAKNLEEKVKTLRAEVATGRDSAELENEAKSFDAKAAVSNDRAEALRKEKAWLEEGAAIDDEERAIKTAAVELEARRAARDEAVARIAASDKAREIRSAKDADVVPKEKAFEEKGNALEKREKDWQRYVDGIPRAEQRASETNTALETARAAEAAAAGSLAEARRIDNEISLAMQALSNAESAAFPLRGALNEATNRTTKATKDLQKATEAVKAAGNAMVTAQKLAEVVDPLRETYEKACAEKEAAEKAHDTAARTFTEETEPRLESLLESLREKQRLADAVKSLDDYRKTLKAGEPCPLCGATEHPYAEGLPTPDDVQQEINAAAAELKATRESVAKLASKVVLARADVDKALEQLQAAEKAANSAKSNAEASLGAAETRRKILEESLPAVREAESSARRALDDAESKVQEAKRNLEVKRMARAAIPFKDADAEERRLRKATEDATREKGEAEKALSLAKQQEESAAKEVEKARSELQVAKKELEAAQAAFSDRLVRAGFGTEAEWLTACLADDDRQQAEDCRDKFTRDEASLGGRRTALGDRRCKHDSSPDRPAVVRELAVVVGELEAAELDRENAVASAAALRTEIKTQGEQVKRLQDAVAAAAKQQEMAKKWNQLDKFLGGPDGKAFKLYAQGRNLRMLLDSASPRLETMSGGDYRFEWDPASGTLEPFVRDRHFESPRPVSNLSGGESFLASLALALSFSNFNTERAPIETLFLDEGFGTLDEVALDRALDVLSALRDTGRQVGLVTHVGQVKERISAHIEVEKAGTGYSTLVGPGVKSIATPATEVKKKGGRRKKDPQP